MFRKEVFDDEGEVSQARTTGRVVGRSAKLCNGGDTIVFVPEGMQRCVGGRGRECENERTYEPVA
jgi:hypothetical protein